MNYEEIKNSASEVLVEFYASWCPHCQRMMPIVDDVKKRMTGKVSVYQFDVDKFEALTNENHVESYPTFIIYRDGKEVWRNAGEMSEDELINTLESFE